MLRLLPALLLLPWAPVSGEEGADDPVVRLYNVQIEDAHGTSLDLSGFHRASGPDRFEGSLGSSSIEVPYSRLREIRVLPPAAPGGRPRARLTLLSGNSVEATFDERERDAVVTGFCPFGRARIVFGAVGRIRFDRRTEREDLPDFGAAVAGVDAKLVDRDGVSLELSGFRRGAGASSFRLALGEFSLEVPVRIVRTLRVGAERAGARYPADVTLADGTEVRFSLPVSEENTLFRAEAEFGTIRVRFADVRELEIRRTTPPLRDLDPVESAGASGEPRRN